MKWVCKYGVDRHMLGGVLWGFLGVLWARFFYSGSQGHPLLAFIMLELFCVQKVVVQCVYHVSFSLSCGGENVHP